MIKGRARRFLTVGVVLTATAAVLPTRSYEPEQPTTTFYMLCPAEPGVHVSCGFPEGVPASPALPASFPPGEAPKPTRPATDGVPGCVTGPDRPVVGTTTPTMSVTFTAQSPEPFEAVFEQQPLDGSEDTVRSNTTVRPGETVVNDVDEKGLEPGASYRWRAGAAPLLGEVSGWSDWCEFTVAAGLVDMRGVTDVDAVRALGVDPNRSYPVTLSGRQWRLVLESFGSGEPGPAGEDEWTGTEVSDETPRISATIRRRAGGEPATVTLTGDDWATTVAGLAALAYAWDETAAEDPQIETDGTAYWKVVDRISAELDGPRRLDLGYER